MGRIAELAEAVAEPEFGVADELVGAISSILGRLVDAVSGRASATAHEIDR